MNKILIDYIIELIQRGNVMPIKTLNYGKEQVFIYSRKNDFFLYGELTGSTLIPKENIINNFLDGTYSLGYCRALDKYNMEIKEGDRVGYTKGIGIVQKVILDVKELYKLRTGETDFKIYYKYDNIVKPIVIVKPTHVIQENKYTGIEEMLHVKNTVKSEEHECSRLIKLPKEVIFNIKSHE